MMKSISAIAQNLYQKFRVNTRHQLNNDNFQRNILGREVKKIKNTHDNYTVIYKTLAFDKNNTPLGITNSFSGTKEAGLIVHGNELGRFGFDRGSASSNVDSNLSGRILTPIQLVNVIVNKGINPQDFGIGPLHLLACYSGSKSGGVGQELANIIQRPVVTYGNNEKLCASREGVRNMSSKNYSWPYPSDKSKSKVWTKSDRDKIANLHLPRVDPLANMIMKNFTEKDCDLSLIKEINLILNDMVNDNSNDFIDKLSQSAQVVKFIGNKESQAKINNMFINALNDKYIISTDEDAKLKLLTLSINIQIENMSLSSQDVKNINAGIETISSCIDYDDTIRPKVHDALYCLQQMVKEGDVKALKSMIEEYKDDFNLA